MDGGGRSGIWGTVVGCKAGGGAVTIFLSLSLLSTSCQSRISLRLGYLLLWQRRRRREKEEKSSLCIQSRLYLAVHTISRIS